MVQTLFTQTASTSATCPLKLWKKEFATTYTTCWMPYMVTTAAAAATYLVNKGKQNLFFYKVKIYNPCQAVKVTTST